MGHCRVSVLFPLVATLVLQATLAGDVKLSLFDGRGLGGWTAVHGAKFSVKDSVLRLDGGMGWLRTEHRFRDFVLSLEWRALAKKHDSGIFFRAPLDGKPWPSGYPVNLLEDQIGTLVGAD